jgi:hypothetical protein
LSLFFSLSICPPLCSFCLSVYLSFRLFFGLFVHMHVSLLFFLSVRPSIRSSVCLPALLSFCLYVHLSFSLYVRLSVYTYALQFSCLSIPLFLFPSVFRTKCTLFVSIKKKKILTLKICFKIKMIKFELAPLRCFDRERDI